MIDIELRGNMDGWDVGRTAREVDSAMPVVYITGNHGDEWASKGVPNSLLLAKPFALAQLVTAIANLLNTVTPPAAPAEAILTKYKMAAWFRNPQSIRSKAASVG
ncbi:response regulator [Bradyrhizobium sp. AUGA SZCCT0182]|uniref:response regulator n=1 Tax=Bradyrhizobium sp. AUGA SZCCT0182 TaxID=2807667 RepID=UPI00289BDBDA|nr:response regulator [Bradyrhizobium sp. AUGA SZCCT0182]